MSQIIKKRERKEEAYFVHEFSSNEYVGSGYSFDCKEDGTLSDTLTDCAKNNYKKCLNGTYNVTNKGIVKRINSYVEDAILLCDCGNHIQLTGSYCGANECSNCGNWYNINGQRLNPPSQWLEDFDED